MAYTENFFASKASRWTERGQSDDFRREELMYHGVCPHDIQFFTDVSITEENGIPYLKAMFKGKKPVSERLLKLDAERFKKGDLPLSNLLSKYCSYIAQCN